MINNCIIVMDIKKFQDKILRYYEEQGRELPWRKTVDPYHILVSEIMLQQTQVDRVIPKYEAFLDAYPSVENLAKADTQKLMSLWSGLGYNSRAIRLREAAQVVEHDFAGKVPDDEENLLGLPGIGPYTARAVQAFAFNKDVVVIDTNIRRIFIHEFGLSEDVSQKELEEIGERVLPIGRSRIWYNALMDYGAMEMTSRATGIRPVGRQSKFQGSVRQSRGKIVKFLVAEKKSTYSVLRRKFDHVDEALLGLEKDGLVTRNRDSIVLR